MIRACEHMQLSLTFKYGEMSSGGVIVTPNTTIVVANRLMNLIGRHFSVSLRDDGRVGGMKTSVSSRA